MRRWVTALVALAIGGGVSAALLVFANPQRDTVEVLAAAADMPAGTTLRADSAVIVRVSASNLPAAVLRANEASKLAGLHATHQLAAGQLLQSSDVANQNSASDRRLVFIPVKDAPPAAAGSRVDLLVVDGSPDHLSVSSFALDVEVAETVSGGLVVVVSSKQAPAFVYASSVMRLTAVVAEPGAAPGAEGAVSSPEQALSVASQP
jgi:hypothetical protein